MPCDNPRVRVFFGLACCVVIASLLTGCFGASCKAQEVHGTNMTCNGGDRGYMWTGTGCIYTVACNCTGPDCQRLYATQDACETAHIHCR
jgi:hypothetical protein